MLASKRSVTFFSNRDQIKTQITQALGPFHQQAGISGWVRGPLDSGPALLFPQTWRVGHGYLPDVEKSHSVAAITAMLWDRPRALLRLGSPHLRYWAASSDEARLRWFMENTKHIRVEIALFRLNGRLTPSYKKTRSHIGKECRALTKLYPKRLEFKMSNRTSDISYIIYPLSESDGLTSRAMIGVQTTRYNERPFVELVYTSESPPPLVLAAQSLHEDSFHA